MKYKGILLYKGKNSEVYLFYEDDKSEVKEQLIKFINSKKEKGVAKAFRERMKNTANIGLEKLPRANKGTKSVGQWDMWDENGVLFFEYKQGKKPKRNRLSFFKYEPINEMDSLKYLVCTYFFKTKDKETKEYKRAIKQKNKFDSCDNNTRWIKENSSNLNLIKILEK